MSEMQPPSDEPSFAHYWAWVAREKVEQEVFRLMRTTPGIVDRSHVVKDIEAASKELVACRKEHLQDLINGWEIMEKTMNREIAIRIFNEFIAGSRTLEDFERINFSKKNKDQQGKPRSHFPAHLNGHPMLSRGSIGDLHRSGALPTTATIYSAQTAEYFEESATDKYYDLVFGDAGVFYGVLTKHNPNPNMPAARAIPMPYHPNMDKQDKDFVKWFQITQPYIPQQQITYAAGPPPPMQMQPMQPMQPMQQIQQMPFVGYPPMPAFIPVPVQMQPMPMQVPQDTVYAGGTYQQPQSNGNYVNTRNQGGNLRNQGGNNRQGGQYKSRNIRNEQNGRYQNGYDNSEMVPSSSSVHPHMDQSDEEKQETSTSNASIEAAVTNVTKEEAFPALDGQGASRSLNVDVNFEEQPGTSAQPDVATAAMPTPRSFSEVVCHSVSASASTADISEPRATVDEEDEDESNRPSPPSNMETPSGTSDSRSVTSESVEAVSEATTSSSVSASKSDDSKQASTSDASSTSTSARTPAAPAEPLSSTSALVVDTTEQSTTAAPSASYRTVAEVVQKSLTSAPSPAARRVNGSNSTQPSPAVNSNISSPGQKGTSAAQITPRQKQDNTNSDNRKPARSPKKPSMSYAQMLYPAATGSSASSRSKQSSSSLSAGALSTSQNKKTTTTAAEANPLLPTDWHTVKTSKKNADPAIVSPPVQTPTTARKQIAPKPAPEPVVSDEKEEEDVASDDPEAEKKREQRRQKRQRQKEENKQKKQQLKELARQESLARVEQMNGESRKDGESNQKEPSPPPKPAFDREDIRSRRQKRKQLQKKTELEFNSAASTNANSPPNVTPATFPLIPLIPTGMGSNPMGAAITAGQTAMSAYGMNNFRRNSPFSLITPSGATTLPLYLPPQDGLRANQDGYTGALLLEDVSDKKFIPVQLVRQLDPENPPPAKTEIDENAEMVEKLLLFESTNKLKSLKTDGEEFSFITKGLNDVKKMYSRVEKAGQLVSYKSGSSHVPPRVEEKLMNLAIKLLSNRVELSEQDEKVCSEIGGKIATCSSAFNYTNYLTALVDFADERAKQLPEPEPLRKNYEQCVVLTKVYLKRTKNLYETIGKYFDIANLKEEEEYNSLLL